MLCWNISLIFMIYDIIQIMILACNIGNTHIAISFYINKEWKSIHRINSKVIRTFDEYEILFRGILSSYDISKCTLVAIASVVPSLTFIVKDAFYKIMGVPILNVNADLKLPISNTPRELGNDLLANAVGGFVNSNGKAAIIVDFGTALTCTAVNSTGEVMGVSISPGIHNAYCTLIANASLLSNIPLVMPHKALATTTEDAINVGVMLGYKYLVRGIVMQMQEELGEEVKYFATGGYAEHIASQCDIFHVVNQYHTLDGIRIIAEHNIIP